MINPVFSHFTSTEILTVTQVIDRILAGIPGGKLSDTVDTLKSGSGDTVVTGIVTTMFCTVRVIESAAKIKANFIIAHEPTFYNHQDNENWVGPSAVQSKEGIRNCDWTALAGGDGFYVLFDPTDRDTFYAESQQGEVHRINLQNGEIRRLRPEPAEGQLRYRFNWNSPMIMSRHSRA